MNIGKLCTREVSTILASAPVIEAAKRMREEHVGDLIVIRETAEGAGKPLGIITDRDIVVMLVARGMELFDQLVVGDLITRPLIVAHADEDSLVVARRMREHCVRRVPVLDEWGGLMGILTADDLIGAINADLDEIAHLVCNQARQEADWRP